jgi:hypothetical protein
VWSFAAGERYSGRWSSSRRFHLRCLDAGELVYLALLGLNSAAAVHLVLLAEPLAVDSLVTVVGVEKSLLGLVPVRSVAVAMLSPPVLLVCLVLPLVRPVHSLWLPMVVDHRLVLRLRGSSPFLRAFSGLWVLSQGVIVIEPLPRLSISFVSAFSQLPLTVVLGRLRDPFVLSGKPLWPQMLVPRFYDG